MVDELERRQHQDEGAGAAIWQARRSRARRSSSTRRDNANFVLRGAQRPRPGSSSTPSASTPTTCSTTAPSSCSRSRRSTARRRDAGRRMMMPQEVIRRPLITEKSTRLKEASNTVCFEVAPRRQQDRGQAGGRDAVRRQGRRRARRATVHGKLKRMGRFVGQRQTGRRPTSGSRRARSDRVLRGRVEERWPVKKFKPTSPGRRFQTTLDFRGAHAGRARRSASRRASARPAAATTRAGSTVRFMGGGHKRRYRIIDFRRDKHGHPGEGRVDRVRPEPLGAHRAAPLRRRREALHPRARRPEGRRDGGRRAPTADILPGNALPLQRDPARHDDPQHRAEARQGRPDRALGRRRPRS